MVPHKNVLQNGKKKLELILFLFDPSAKCCEKGVSERH